jgi:hypothetical protein
MEWLGAITTDDSGGLDLERIPPLASLGSGAWGLISKVRLQDFLTKVVDESDCNPEHDIIFFGGNGACIALYFRTRSERLQGPCESKANWPCLELRAVRKGLSAHLTGRQLTAA